MISWGLLLTAIPLLSATAQICLLLMLKFRRQVLWKLKVCIFVFNNLNTFIRKQTYISKTEFWTFACRNRLYFRVLDTFYFLFTFCIIRLTPFCRYHILHNQYFHALINTVFSCFNKHSNLIKRVINPFSAIDAYVCGRKNLSSVLYVKCVLP